MLRFFSTFIMSLYYFVSDFKFGTFWHRYEEKYAN